MFNGSQNTIIRGGTFNVHHSPVLANIQTEGFKILYGNIATGAFHNSGERFDPPKCHPNTRRAVLADIMRWIENIWKLDDVLWLYGSAGVGKSAIAQTIAEMCDKLNLLVASFFFSRSSPIRNNEKRLIASIAYQLALSIPATRLYIESAVQLDPAIFDKALVTQTEMLIIRPLQSACADVHPDVAKEWPRLIIVDGLDECDRSSVQSSIIRVLSTALQSMPLPLILLVASRPEPNIRNTFNLVNNSHHIFLDSSYKPDADIKEFLLCRFKDIKEHHRLSAYIPKSWPSVEIIDRLVRKSSGQFIYASTVMKYLDSPKHKPKKRLDVILGLIPVENDLPFQELDALYRHIFSCVEDRATTRKILGYLMYRYHRYLVPVTPDFLSHLVGLDEEDVHICLAELHSILNIPPPGTHGGEIRMTHASLKDFLVDKLRSGKYYLDEEAFHTEIAQQCARLISTLPTSNIGHYVPGLVGFTDYEAYLITSFIHHCTNASPNSAELKNDLSQVPDLRPWFELKPPHHDRDLPFVFEWLSKSHTPSEALTRHLQSLWDQYLTTALNEHTFNGNNVDIAGFLFFPPTWHPRWFSLTSAISQLPIIFEWYPTYPELSVDSSISDYYEPYRLLLTDYFEDRNRSGKYHLDGTVYARAALECLRNMFNLNDDEVFNPYPFLIMGIEQPDAKLFMSLTDDLISQREILIPNYKLGLDAVSRLITKAAPTTDLYDCLRDHPLQNLAKAKIHCEHGFASLRLAVKIYLDKCNHLCPKLIRRSPSCPPDFRQIDLVLKFSKHLGTFHEKWPLACDRSARSSPWIWPTTALGEMRTPPEMTVPRSRNTKIV